MNHFKNCHTRETTIFGTTSEYPRIFFSRVSNDISSSAAISHHGHSERSGCGSRLVSLVPAICPVSLKNYPLPPTTKPRRLLPFEHVREDAVCVNSRRKASGSKIQKKSLRSRLLFFVFHFLCLLKYLPDSLIKRLGSRPAEQRHLVQARAGSGRNAEDRIKQLSEH